MLRKHQKDLIELLKKEIIIYKKTGKFKKKIIIDVFPGGGKSILAIIATKMLKDAGIIDKVCWVVPRILLKNQGSEEFLKNSFKSDFPHDLEIRETETINDVDPTRGSDGYITTYQALSSAKSNNSQINNNNINEFKQKKYLLFLDEIQHIAENNKDKTGYSFYQAINPLAENAAVIIGVSGTLFRHEQDRIAFVDYDEKTNKPFIDIIYNHDDAIKDKAIIPIYFDNGKPSKIEYEKNGKKFSKSKFETNTDLGVAIDSGYGQQLLMEGVNLWQDYKLKSDIRSKLIILGYDQNHCRKILKDIENIGLNGCLAISDEGSQAQRNIKLFRTINKHDILITCQMAYEGLDCKQATHLIALTKIRSIPWLIQALTRIMRFDPNSHLPWEEQQCFAIIPNDEDMIEALKYIKAKPTTYIKNDALEFLDSIKRLEPLPVSNLNFIENKKSDLDCLYQSDLNGQEIPSILSKKIKLFRDKNNLRDKDLVVYNMLKNSNMLSILDQFYCIEEIQKPEIVVKKTIREMEKEERDNIQNLTNKLDYKFNFDHGTWNKKAFNRFRNKKRKDMTLVELQEVRNWLKEEAIKEAKIMGMIV